jgi:hypothetical protein
MSASSSTHCRRMSAASSGAIDWSGACGKASNRSSWRRVRSMNARPWAKVIVPVGSDKPMTDGAGINPLLFANEWQVSVRTNTTGNTRHGQSDLRRGKHGQGELPPEDFTHGKFPEWLRSTP